MKTIEPTQKPAKVDNDPNLFIGILMVVVLGMVWVTLKSNPEIRKPVKLIPFTYSRSYPPGTSLVPWINFQSSKMDSLVYHNSRDYCFCDYNYFPGRSP